MIDIVTGYILQKAYIACIAFLGLLFQVPATILEGQITQPSRVEASEGYAVVEKSPLTKDEDRDLSNSNQGVSIEEGYLSDTSHKEQDVLQNATIDNEYKAQGDAVSDVVHPPSQGEVYEVIAVVDGDTIKVATGGVLETLRVIGINTPETVDPRRPMQCFGKEASKFAKELLLGKRVVLEADHTQQDRDKYGRLLRYVFINGSDYGEEMIREGYAYEYTYNVPYLYQAKYKEAQVSAHSEGKGLWNVNTCGSTTKTPDMTSLVSSAYYTSSSPRATSYYPASCDAWKSLSKTYLQTFHSISELLKVYPGRTLSKQCD